MRIAVSLLAAAVLGTSGCAWEDAATRSPAGDGRAAREPTALFGLLFDESFGRPELARLGRLTLRPSGRSVSLGHVGGGFAYSPNGSRVALAVDVPPGIELVRLGLLRREGRVDLPRNAFVAALAWSARRMLYAALSGERRATVVRLDPATRRITARFVFSGQLVAADAIRDGIALLLSPPDAIGPLRLVVVDGGQPRAVDLGVEGGWGAVGDARDPVVRQEVPGFAVDPAGEHAAVAPAGRTIAEIDLGTLAVRYHRLHEPRSILARLRDWLQPEAEAKVVDGSVRQAVWLADGVLAVTGADYEPPERTHEPITTPAGLALIDLDDGTMRVVDRDVSAITAAGGTLLAYGTVARSPGREAPTGITGYDARGRKLFVALQNQPVDDVRVAGRYVYVASSERRLFRILDWRSGRVVAAPRTRRPTMLLAEM